MNSFVASQMIRLVTVALGGNYPMRLVLGLALGVFLKMVVHTVASSQLGGPQTVWSALDDFAMVYFMFVVAPLPFIPIIFSVRTAPEGISHQINTVRVLLDEEKATQERRAYVWRSLTNKYFSALTPDLRQGPSLETLIPEAENDRAKIDPAGVGQED
jgi:hypothetical protein